jgi:dihydropteroate synthase
LQGTVFFDPKVANLFVFIAFLIELALLTLALPMPVFTKPKPYSIRIKDRLLSLESPVVMGIINTTPDSFFSGSRAQTLDAVLASAAEMLEQGATILDIGGYSTRPGASDVLVQEELDRVIPAIEAITQEFPEVIISIDTFRSEVAKASVAAGAHIVNDVSGGNADAAMFETVAELGVPYILMHSRGNPQTMASLNQYNHLSTDIVKELASKLAQLRALGVVDVVIDPGFGFAKNMEQNFQLLNELSVFQELDCPLLVGISNKGMIYKTLGIEPAEALNGTTVLNTIGLLQGAHIIRVHQVKEAMQCVRLLGTMLHY